MFYCELYEISKNTFFKEHLRTTAFIIIGSRLLLIVEDSKIQ